MRNAIRFFCDGCVKDHDPLCIGVAFILLLTIFYAIDSVGVGYKIVTGVIEDTYTKSYWHSFAVNTYALVKTTSGEVNCEITEYQFKSLRNEDEVRLTIQEGRISSIAYCGELK